MISITLSFCILGGVSELFLAASQSHDDQNAISAIQENSRIANFLLRSDLHKAGYLGCAKLTADFPIKNSTSIEFNAANRIVGSTDSVYGDHFTIRYMNPDRAVLLNTMSDHTVLVVSSNPEFKQGDILVISNCNNADVFMVKEVWKSAAQQKILTNNPLSTLYGLTTDLGRLEINTYFVAKTARKNKAHQPIYALYVENNSSNKRELIENVRSMSVKYWEKGNSQYERGVDEVDEWASVKGVALKLNFISENNLKTVVSYLDVML